MLFSYKRKGNTTIVYNNREMTWIEVNGVVQSAISNEAPFRPLLPHYFIMLLPLIHDTKPNTILELGAGALALQRYLKITQPDIDIKSVEYDSTIIKACTQTFPKFEGQQIIQQDAYSYIEKAVKKKALYDWVIVDLFDGKHSSFIDNMKKFTNQIKLVLNHNGWLIINTLQLNHQQLDVVSNNLKSKFNVKVFIFAVPKTLNHIVMIKNTKKNFIFPQEIEQHNLSAIEFKH